MKIFGVAFLILDAVVEIVDPMMLLLAMREGLYDIDIGSSFPQSAFTKENRDVSNVQFLFNPMVSNGNW